MRLIGPSQPPKVYHLSKVPYKVEIGQLVAEMDGRLVPAAKGGEVVGVCDTFFDPDRQSRANQFTPLVRVIPGGVWETTVPPDAKEGDLIGRDMAVTSVAEAIGKIVRVGEKLALALKPFAAEE